MITEDVPLIMYFKKDETRDYSIYRWNLIFLEEHLKEKKKRGDKAKPLVVISARGEKVFVGKDKLGVPFFRQLAF